MWRSTRSILRSTTSAAPTSKQNYKPRIQKEGHTSCQIWRRKKSRHLGWLLCQRSGLWRVGLGPNVLAMALAIGGRNGLYPTMREVGVSSELKKWNWIMNSIALNTKGVPKSFGTHNMSAKQWLAQRIAGSSLRGETFLEGKPYILEIVDVVSKKSEKASEKIRKNQKRGKKSEISYLSKFIHEYMDKPQNVHNIFTSASPMTYQK